MSLSYRPPPYVRPGDTDEDGRPLRPEQHHDVPLTEVAIEELLIAARERALVLSDEKARAHMNDAVHYLQQASRRIGSGHLRRAVAAIEGYPIEEP